jgi:hypothetical protein
MALGPELALAEVAAAAFLVSDAVTPTSDRLPSRDSGPPFATGLSNRIVPVAELSDSSVGVKHASHRELRA